MNAPMMTLTNLSCFSFFRKFPKLKYLELIPTNPKRGIYSSPFLDIYKKVTNTFK